MQKKHTALAVVSITVETIMLNGFETSSCTLTGLDICSVQFSRNHTMLSLLCTLIYCVSQITSWVVSIIYNFSVRSEIYHLFESQSFSVSFAWLNIYSLSKGS